MSGGYFDYEDNRLLDFAQKIENEIRCNDNDEETYDEDLCMHLPAGLHAADVTLFIMRKIVEDCDKLANYCMSLTGTSAGIHARKRSLHAQARFMNSPSRRKWNEYVII